MREFCDDLPERLVIGEPGRLQLPVPTADELVRRLREVPEHICDHARGFGVAEWTGACEVLHKIAMLLDRGDLHDLMMTAPTSLRKNSARYRAGLDRMVLLEASLGNLSVKHIGSNRQVVT
jgi:hypothetical protein